MRVSLLLVFSVTESSNKPGPMVIHKYISDGGYLLTLKNEMIDKAVVF